ncbi:MAG: CDP-diacylglycerol--glycerol-3-phosphate 3-phosphatidyltransferase [Myxococcota bacterium]
MARTTTLKQEFTNLPNIITMFRIAVIPLVLVFIDNASPLRSFIATVIYTAACVSDFLDGWLARRRGLISVLGKFLDPLADKLLVMATLVWMVERERAPAWLVVVLLAREFAITGLRSIASTEGIVIAASEGGKYKTALQMVGILGLIIHFDYTLIGTSVTVNFHLVGMWVLYLSLAFSLFSFADYIRGFGVAVARQAIDRGAAE